MWEQSLSGLIKALRASKDDEQRVIRQALEETKREVKSTDLDLKAGAVLKLCYLEMLGLPDLASSSFHVIECMSSSKFHIKQVGYLAAAQSFGPHTEVAMLTTNLVKKDLSSPNPATAPLLGTSSTPPPVLSLALSSLPHLLTAENSPDLTPDLVSMLNHSRPAIRRRAVLVMHTLARQDQLAKLRDGSSTAGRVTGGYVEGDDFDGVTGGPARLGPSSSGENVWVERLRERLRDDDAGVVSATVNVICELAMKDPLPWLEVAPELYGLLTAGNNNWMLIKIVKLFAVLTPIEPRLVKKLLPPLTNLINTTSAMSLLYECLSTIISGGLLSHSSSVDTSALASTCVDKLSGFLEDADQNLRYIALVALARLVPDFPHLVSRYHDTILASVDDPDETIRMRALELVEGMVDRTNLRSIVEQLMGHLAPTASFRRGTQSAAAAALAGAATSTGAAPALSSAKYRHYLVSLILNICARDTYSNIPDFEWYIDTLVALSYIALSLPPSLSTDAVASPSSGSGTATPNGASAPAKAPTSMGARIAEHLVNVCARVKAIRPYASKRLLRLLDDETFLSNVATDTRASPSSEVGEIVGAAAWVCAEYCRPASGDEADPRPIMSALFSTKVSSAVSPSVLAVCFHNGVKVFSRYVEKLRRKWDQLNEGRPETEDLEQIAKVVAAIRERTEECRSSEDVELQERAAEFAGLMEYLKQGLEGFKLPEEPAPAPVKEEPARKFGGEEDEANPFASSEVESQRDDDGPDEAPEAAAIAGPSCLHLLDDLFFSYDLNPVASKAQAMIAPPEGLDLDSWIVPHVMAVQSADLLDGLEGDASGAEVDEYGRRRFPEVVVVPQAGPSEGTNGKVKKTKRRKEDGEGKTKRKGKRREEDDPEVLARAREERLERQREDPYYISERSKAPRPRSKRKEDDADIDDVDSIPIVKLDLSETSDLPQTTRRPPPAPRRPPTPPIIDIEGEMPAGHLLRPKAGTPAAVSGPTNGSSTPASGSGVSRTATPLPAEEQELTGAVPKKVVKKKRKVPKPKPSLL